jgi:hypothetical protein
MAKIWLASASLCVAHPGCANTGDRAELDRGTYLISVRDAQLRFGFP